MKDAVTVVKIDPPLLAGTLVPDFSIELKNPDGSDADLTGYAARCQFRPLASTGPAVLDYGTAENSIVISGNELQFVAKAGVKAGKYFGDVLIKAPSALAYEGVMRIELAVVESYTQPTA